jgi:cellulose synthase/poly-beta-1,6-N-acetylglucosamine synthase-like glycosyltransferase
MGLVLLEFVGLFVAVVYMTYVVMIVLPFLRRKRTVPGNHNYFQWHLFVPARDEDSVIEMTMARCRADFPTAHVWIIDDASTDRTAAIVAETEAGDPHVHLVRRVTPDARTGKGAALNAAYRALDAWLPADADRTRAIISVIDADGRLARDALDYVSSDTVFGDPAVGAAQVAVRMENRDDLGDLAPSSRLGRWFSRYLVRMQDLEFMTTMSAMQLLREKTGSVGMGGNGQFSRLSALDEVARRYQQPWHGALLEDYELGLHILLVGYHNKFVYETRVEQEGLTMVRRLLAQRSRWTQGAMQCSSYVADIVRSPNFTNAGMVESCYFLLNPWLQVLGVILWPTFLVLTTLQALHYPGGLGSFVENFWPVALLAALFGAAPFIMWGPIYRRQVEPSIGWFRGWLLGIGNALYICYTYFATPRAVVRMLRGRHGWAKTRRNAELVTTGPVASDI